MSTTPSQPSQNKKSAKYSVEDSEPVIEPRWEIYGTPVKPRSNGRHSISWSAFEFHPLVAKTPPVDQSEASS
jgi:hypothetical protein